MFIRKTIVIYVALKAAMMRKKKGKKEKKESSDKFKIHCKEMSNCRNKKNM